MNHREPITTDLNLVKDNVFYKVADLKAILKNLGLNYSIYTIRDYETYKCLNYHCGKRHNEPVEKCLKCGGEVRAPLIKSPRTLGGGKGVGHRMYTGAEIKSIVEAFKPGHRTMLKDFHHYKGSDLSSSEKVERKVIELLFSSKLPNNQRDSSIVWELKHSSGCCQIARILAQKRKLDVELAEVSAILHDIYVIVEGKYKDHAKFGGPIAKQILEEIGGFSEQETQSITEAVAHHSEKEVHSNKPYVELVKDVDVVDCSLYKGAEGFYRIHKPEEIFKEYVNRIKTVRKELGLNPEEVFRD